MSETPTRETDREAKKCSRCGAIPDPFCFDAETGLCPIAWAIAPVATPDPEPLRTALETIANGGPTTGQRTGPMKMYQAQALAKAALSASPAPVSPETCVDWEGEARKLLWLNHGCNGHPYGDDGEMQCCLIDFKRWDWALIRERVTYDQCKRINEQLQANGFQPLSLPSSPTPEQEKP